MQLDITANCEADEPFVQYVVWHLGHAVMRERRNGNNSYSTSRSGKPWTPHPGPHGQVPRAAAAQAIPQVAQRAWFVHQLLHHDRPA